MTTTDEHIPPTGGGPYIAGDTLTIELVVTDDVENPINLQNADVAFTVAPYRGEPATITKTRTDGITVTDPTAGEITIEITESDTTGMGTPDGRSYPFDVSITDDAGNRNTAVIGEWTIHAPVGDG